MQASGHGRAKRGLIHNNKRARAFGPVPFCEVALAHCLLYSAAMARILNVLLVAGAAAAAAGALAKFTHSELGLSPTVIRDAALLCSGMLGVGLFSCRFGGPK
jgi:hypothetical protein